MRKNIVIGILAFALVLSCAYVGICPVHLRSGGWTCTKRTDIAFPAGDNRLIAVHVDDDRIVLNTQGIHPAFAALFKADGTQTFGYVHWKSGFTYSDLDGDGVVDKMMITTPPTKVFLMQKPVWVPQGDSAHPK